MRQWNLTFLPWNDGNKQTGEYIVNGVAPAADDISIYLGNEIQFQRQVEITNLWRWLAHQVKEQHRLPLSSGGPLFAGCVITGDDYRTSSSLDDFDDDDLVIGIGSNVAAEPYTNILDNGFRVLIDFALERTLKQLTVTSDITHLGEWYVVGDSKTSPDGSGSSGVNATRSWIYLLQDEGLVTPTINAAGGRGFFANGFSDWAWNNTWDIADAPPGINAVVFLGTNDAVNAGINTFNSALVRLVNALIDNGNTPHLVYPPDLPVNSIYQPYLGTVRNWMQIQESRVRDAGGDFFAVYHDLSNMLDGLHGNQEDQYKMADQMYQLMLGVVRRQSLSA